MLKDGPVLNFLFYIAIKEHEPASEKPAASKF